MIVKHFGSGMTLRALIPSSGTTCGDGVSQYQAPTEAVLKPGLGPVYLLVSRCWDVMAQPEDFMPELPGDHEEPLLPPPPTFSRGICGETRGTGSS